MSGGRRAMPNRPPPGTAGPAPAATAGGRNLVDHLSACWVPDRPALITEKGTHTYAELRAAVDGMAAALLDLGVRPAEFVGLFADNSLFWAASYLGALKVGATVLPFTPTLLPGQFGEILASTSPRVFCLQEKYYTRFRGQYPPGSVMVAEDEAAAARLAGRFPARPLRPGPPVASVPVDDRTALAALMFTSGSTGTPRAVMVSHRNIIANTDSIIASLGLDGHDRMMVVLPFSYCFGTSLLHTHLRVGGSLVLNNRFTFPNVVLEHLRASACTGLAGVPSTYQILLRNTPFPRLRFPALEKFQQAGGKLPDAFIAELRRAHPDVKYFLMYGQTEATARLSCLPPECLDARPGSIGRGIPGVELRVLDPEGNPVCPGTVGEIVARGENITLGYWKDAEATARTFRDGALWTGDLARVDEEGFIYVVDRAKDFIKPTGHRVASRQVEDHLVELDDVVEAAVVGIPDDVLGEAVKACLVLRRGSSLGEGEVLAHCRRVMPPFLVPRQVVFLRALPKNSSGKVDKAALKAGRDAAGP